MREPVLLMFCGLLVCSAALHVFMRSKLRAVRAAVHQAMARDEERWRDHETKGLGPLREAFGVSGGADVKSALEQLNRTQELLRASTGLIDKLGNETKELYDWMQNHQLLSHGVARGLAEPATTRVCIPISITTRGTKWKRLEQMLLLTSFLPSLVRTVEAGFQFGVYLGYDAGDPMLDAPGAQEKLRELFKAQVQGTTIEVRSYRYEDSKNRNVWAVNYITRECYLDGYDYFYRVNDDSAFEGPWASVLTSRIRESNNFGVVGVYDKGNPRIFTHSLVGRPHVEVFGYYFPFEFGNYWSDDWITAVYEAPYIYKSYDVAVKHHIHAERYRVEYERKPMLEEMVKLGRERWKAYLCFVRKKKDYCSGDQQLYESTWQTL